MGLSQTTSPYWSFPLDNDVGKGFSAEINAVARETAVA